VTISVPLSASASAIAWFEENFPVPSSSRERKVRPAMTSGSVGIARENTEAGILAHQNCEAIFET
jgi:hypothetical protein